MAAAYDLNLNVPFRDALLQNATLTALLANYDGEPAIFTRRPVPVSNSFPMIIVGDPASIADDDSLTKFHPRVRLDLIAYGQQPDDYRTIQKIGFLMRKQFHRRKFSLAIPNYSVLDIVVNGPIVAPTDDEKECARACLITLRLTELP